MVQTNVGLGTDQYGFFWFIIYFMQRNRETQTIERFNIYVEKDA
jgi:hypothetical protein